ncbi:hypothetical protein CK222_30055 [Mesorhizobium sp. WSM3866]|nr:hypothetical protein CK222_30055 [Mesorhizobium sp. WSM3866]
MIVRERTPGETAFRRGRGSGVDPAFRHQYFGEFAVNMEGIEALERLQGMLPCLASSRGKFAAI